MEAIRRFRKNRGFTQDQLAEMVGVKRSVISKYESGTISPSYVMINKIAAALGIPVLDLVEDAGPVIGEKTVSEALEYDYLSQLDYHLSNMTEADKDLFFRLSLAQAEAMARYSKEHKKTPPEAPQEASEGE